jgi:hypothetical protein
VEVRDRRERLHSIDDIGDDRAERGRRDREVLALDQDDLVLRVHLEAGVAEDLLGLPRLADAVVVLVDGLLSDRHSGDDGHEHECEPPEDRGLPVTCAPATHPGRDVVRFLER